MEKLNEKENAQNGAEQVDVEKKEGGLGGGGDEDSVRSRRFERKTEEKNYTKTSARGVEFFRHGSLPENHV